MFPDSRPAPFISKIGGKALRPDQFRPAGIGIRFLFTGKITIAQIRQKMEADSAFRIAESPVPGC